MKHIHTSCLLYFVASCFISVLCEPVITKKIELPYGGNAIPNPPQYSGTKTQSYLRGKDIENLGWIMASFTHDNVDVSALPKKIFKSYIAAKDRLFVDYLDIFFGNIMSRTGKPQLGSYRMMSTLLRRRLSRHKSASLDKSGSVTSTYNLRGNPAVASRDFSRILALIGSDKGAKQAHIGPFVVSLSNGRKPRQSIITFSLDGFDLARPGCITRRFVYQPRVVRVQLRKSSWLRNLKLKGQKDRAGNRMRQMQLIKQLKAKRKQQKQKQMRMNIQRRRQKQQKRRQLLKAKAKARLQKRLENAKRRKQIAEQRRKAKAELRKKKQQERKAQRLYRQNQRQMKQKERQRARAARKQRRKELQQKILPLQVHIPITTQIPHIDKIAGVVPMTLEYSSDQVGLSTDKNKPLIVS